MINIEIFAHSEQKLAQSLSHLGNGWRVVALRSPSVSKSPRPRLSSHRRPKICCCQLEAAPHRLSVHGESARKNTTRDKADNILLLIFLFLGKRSSKSSGHISSFRREGVQFSPQAWAGPAKAPLPQAQEDLTQPVSSWTTTWSWAYRNPEWFLETQHLGEGLISPN